MPRQRSLRDRFRQKRSARLRRFGACCRMLLSRRSTALPVVRRERELLQRRRRDNHGGRRHVAPLVNTEIAAYHAPSTSREVRLSSSDFGHCALPKPRTAHRTIPRRLDKGFYLSDFSRAARRPASATFFAYAFSIVEAFRF